MGKVLIVAFHFPPQVGSSGNLRGLKFCRYLPQNGWLPVVLTAKPLAYERVDEALVAEIPIDLPVVRAFGLDAKRHLSFRGRYSRSLALPDRWVSWCPSAVLSGLRAIRSHQIDVIFTTFPIATTILVGLILHRITGKPWVVDLRDPMTQGDVYPRDALTLHVNRWIEERAIRRSSRVIFTAPSSISMYLERFSWLRPEKCFLIPNGYDEDDFQGLSSLECRELHANRPVRLLHTGTLYPEERDPQPFFRALARLKREGQVSAATLTIDFRASGFESVYSPMVHDLGIDDIVSFLPSIPYRQGLQDCAHADGLLLFQARCCDRQIPAKAYEYLRLRKPILALTTQTGDTAALLKETGGATIAPLADVDAIHQLLPVFLRSVTTDGHPLPDEAKVLLYTRKKQAEQLAACFSEIRRLSANTAY